jgi:hypothetical protein
MEIDSLIEEQAARRRLEISSLNCWDANVWLGKPVFFPLAETLTYTEIEELLRRYSLQGALVSHWDGLRLSAQDGNQALLETSGALPGNVFTIWTGLPTTPREQEPLPGFGRPDQKMRGVRLFPQTHNYQLSPWVVGELCEWCLEFKLPLFVWHVETRWNDVHDLAVSFPSLSIVVETQWQKILYHIRDLFSLLRSCPNILVESSNLIGQDYLTSMVNYFGADRLLLGSFLPVNDPLTAIGMILDADIDAAAKRQIAGGNIKRLLSEVRV